MRVSYSPGRLVRMLLALSALILLNAPLRTLYQP